MFSTSSPLLILTLLAPSLAPQKPDALGELAFETNPVSKTAICSTTASMSSILCPCQTLLINHSTFFPTLPHAVCQVPNDTRWWWASLFQVVQIYSMLVYPQVSPPPVPIKDIPNPSEHREWGLGKVTEHFYSGLWEMVSSQFQFAWVTAHFSGSAVHDMYTAPFLSQTVADVMS